MIDGWAMENCTSEWLVMCFPKEKKKKLVAMNIQK